MGANFIKKAGIYPNKKKKKVSAAKKKVKSTSKGGPKEYKAGLSGRKIKSKGKGRGLGRGAGKGPISPRPSWK